MERFAMRGRYRGGAVQGIRCTSRILAQGHRIGQGVAAGWTEPGSSLQRAATGRRMPTITVLAIDGGGIRGMIPAAFLNQLEQQTGHAVSELFDYIAGTSTGGILALGLGLKRPDQPTPYTAAQLMSLYVAQGRNIFSELRPPRRSLGKPERAEVSRGRSG
jgi:hypothetical protein